MKDKLNQLSILLDDLIEEAKEPRTREENLELARMYEKIMHYREVDLETALLDDIATKDMQRITPENQREILAEYPAGFYRSELRTYARKQETE